MMENETLPLNDKALSLIDHLIELRKRLLWIIFIFIIAFLGCYYYSDAIFAFLVKPLASLLQGQEGRRLIYTGLTEAFTTYLKVSFFAATFLIFPFFAIQIWLFIAPGLYPLEKKVFRPFLIATPFLFIMGAAFAYYLIIPPAWQFFLHFEQPVVQGSLSVQLEARLSEYLSLVMQLILAFGISFLLPIVIILLAKIGLIKVKTLKKSRKYAFLIILIVSAFITPPDVLSMIGLALPLYLLYELSIFIVCLSEKKSVSKELIT